MRTPAIPRKRRLPYRPIIRPFVLHHTPEGPYDYVLLTDVPDPCPGEQIRWRLPSYR